jgi:hypothetical protein
MRSGSGTGAAPEVIMAVSCRGPQVRFSRPSVLLTVPIVVYMRADSRPGIDPRRGRAPGNAADARQADPGGKGGRRGPAGSAVRRRLTQQVEDALAVCAAFNTADRLADAFGFELLSPEGFEAGAKYLLKRGYR